MYEWEDVKRVRDEANIIEISKFFQLNVSKKGKTYFVPCPFHADWEGDGGSCALNPEIRAYHCFACGAKGNTIDFVEGVFGLHSATSYSDAVRRTHEICGMTFPLRLAKHSSSTHNLLHEFLEENFGEYDEIENEAYLIRETADLARFPQDAKDKFHKVYTGKVCFPVVCAYSRVCDSFVLIERNSKKYIGLFCAESKHLDFSITTTRGKFSTGLALNGKPSPDEEAYPLFETYLNFENPLDYEIALSNEIPAKFGVWAINTKFPKFKVQNGHIPCMIQVHFGDSPSSIQRFQESITPYWLAMQAHFAEVESLCQLDDPVASLASLFKGNAEEYLPKQFELQPKQKKQIYTML